MLEVVVDNILEKLVEKINKAITKSIECGMMGRRSLKDLFLSCSQLSIFHRLDRHTIGKSLTTLHTHVVKTRFVSVMNTIK
jgi:hypothetical protein